MPKKGVKKFKITDLVYRFISPVKKGDKSFWAKEMTLLKKLLEKYPDLGFWQKATLKPVPSFAIYLSTESQYVFLKYQEYLFQPEAPPEPQKILAEKVGEDYHLSNKPRSVKDFLS